MFEKIARVVEEYRRQERTRRRMLPPKEMHPTRRTLAVERLEPRQLLARIVSTSPALDQGPLMPLDSIEATFDEPMDLATIGMHDVGALNLDNLAPSLPGISGGALYDSVKVGSLLYVGTATGLQIFNVSDPTAVARVGGYGTADDVRGVKLVGNVAYLAEETAGLEIVDISDPASVKRLGGYDTSGTAYGVDVAGSVAYVADYSAGLQILAVSDPASVTRLGGYATTGVAWDVKVDGTLAYVADGSGGLQILSVSNPAAVTRLGGYDTSGSALGVELVGSLAYIADGSSGIQILNVANPASVTRLGGFVTSGYSYDLKVVSGVAYVADSSSGLQVLNVATPASVKRLGYYDTPDNAQDVEIAGSLAYIADGAGGLHILDVTSPAAIVRRGGASTWSPAAYDVDVAGSRAYVANDTYGLEILDVSNPAGPMLLGAYDTSGNARGVKVVGNLAYVADSAAGLQILDVTNPAAVVRLGGYDTPDYALGLDVVGNLLYLSDGTAGLEIFNVSNPASPTLLGTYNTSGTASNVKVVGNLAYVADGNSGVAVINVSNPAAMTYVGGYYSSSSNGYVHSIAVAGNVAYLAKDTSGVEILDVSNPAAITRRSVYDTSGSVWDVEVVGSVAYAADGASGLVVLDVSNPAAAQQRGGYDTAGATFAVQVGGNLACLADNTGGLKIVQLGLPAASISLVSGTTYRLAFAQPLQGAAYALQIGPEVLAASGLGMDQDGDGVRGEEAEDMYFARFRVYGPATNISLSSSAALEHRPIGTLVGWLTAIDPDAGDTFTYSLAPGTGDTDNASFTISGNQLLTAAVFDHQSQASCSIRLRVTDSRAMAYERNFTIAISYAGALVTQTAPALDQGAILPLDSLDVTFDQPMDLATLGAQDVGVLNLDKLTPSLLGFCGGQFYDCVQVGSLLYVGMATGLQIFDVSDPLAPVGVGGYASIDDVLDVEVVGSTAYLAEDYWGLEIVDVADVAAVKRLGWSNTAGYAKDVEVVGSVAYVADGSDGLQVFGVANPAAMTVLGGYDTSGYAWGVKVVANRAYVADENSGLQILDVSNLAAITSLGQYDTSGTAYQVEVAGNLAYVADGYSGLHILDVSNPAAVTRLGGYDTSGAANDISLVSGRAYVADGYSGLQIFNVSTPSAVTYLGGYDTPQYLQDVEIAGTLAYVADGYGGLHVLDVSSPAAVTRRGGYDTWSASVNAVDIVGNRAYVANGTNGLAVLDMSNPVGPTLLGVYDTPGTAEGVTVVGNRAYVADGSAGLQILDVSSPAAVKRLGGYDTPGYAYDLTVAGNLVYLSDGSSGLAIVDVANPASPVLLGGYVTSGVAYDVRVAGALAYVADGSSGLEIFNVSDPAKVARVGGYYPSTNNGVSYGIDVVGNLAYLAHGFGWLQILDISNPAAVTRRGWIDTQGMANDVEVVGNLAYVAAGSAGLVVVDVSNPAAGKRLGAYVTSYAAGAVQVAGNLAYMSTSSSGLAIVRLGAPAASISPVEGATYRIGLSPTVQGAAYAVQIGPEVLAAGGMGMDRDGDGVLREDGDDMFFARFRAYGPATDISLSNSTVRENLPAGTLVGWLTTIDPDAGDTSTYTLVAGSGAADNASFSISGNQLLTAAVFDRQAQSSCSIRVRATDSHALQYERTFTIAVTAAGACVTQTDPALDQGPVMPLSSIEVTFDASMDMNTFTTADVGVLNLDDLQPSLLGFYCGSFNDCVKVGSMLYAGTSTGLHVFDVSNPAAPVRLGGCETMNVRGVAVVGTTAYLAADAAGLEIVDVSDPTAVKRLGGYDTPGIANGVDVEGDVAYVADNSTGLLILNVANPAAVTVAGSSYTGGYAWGVDVVGSLAYVAADWMGLLILDVSVPAAVGYRGGYDSWGLAYDVAVVGSRAYLADGNYGLHIVDVANPAAAMRLGGYDTSGTAKHVELGGTQAFVADSSAGLQILDVSQPAAVTRLGGYDTPGSGGSLAVAEGVAYVADGDSGLQVLDVSTPAAVTRRTEYKGRSGYAYDVDVVGTVAYVANGSYGFDVFDERDPASPMWLGSYGGSLYATDVQVVGNLAYVADFLYGLRILDVSNPAAIRLVGGYDSPGSGDGIQVVGNLAYFIDLSAGLVILDVANPASPILLGGYDTPGSARDVDVVGRFAYVADDSTGLHVLDISTPERVTRVGGYDPSTSNVTPAIDVAGNWAYLAVGADGLAILDISDPTQVTCRSVLDTNGIMCDVEVVGSLAYCGDTSYGLVVLDVSDPSAAKWLGQYPTAGSAYGVQVVGNRAYVADTTGGLKVVGLGSPVASIAHTAGSTYRIELGQTLQGAACVVQIGPEAVAAGGSGMDQDGDGVLGEEAEDMFFGRFRVYGPPTNLLLSNSNVLESRPAGTLVGRFAALDPDAGDTFTYSLVAGAGDADNAWFAIDGNQLVTAAPFHRLAKDAYTIRVRATDSRAMEYERDFTIGVISAGPSIVSTSPALDQGPQMPLDSIDVTFDQPMDWTSFSAHDVGVLNLDHLAPSLAGFSGGSFYDCVSVGSLLYVGTATGLQIFDVSDLAAPIRVGGYETLYDVRGIAIVGTTAYLAANYQGLEIVDVSDPAAVQRRGGYSTWAPALGVVVAGDLAYVAFGGTGLQIFDVSDPAALALAGSYDTSGYAWGVNVVGSIAYVADDSAGLQILDVSDPAAVVRLGGYDTTGAAYDVEVVGSRAYVADGYYGLQILDVSNPAAVTQPGGYNTSGTAYHVELAGTLAYVADGSSGLQILDVSQPAAVTRLGGYDTPGSAQSLDVAGGLAYLADTSGGLQILDVAVASAVTRRGGQTTWLGTANDVEIVGDRAFVANDSYGLEILDLSNPAGATHLGQYDTMGYAVDLHVAGNLVYVADGSLGLQILDVSNPATVQRLGGYDTPGYAYAVEVVGNRAYVADGYVGLEVIDIADPASPVLLGVYHTSGLAYDVDVVGDLAYLAAGASGVEVVDVADPAAMTHVGGYLSTAGFYRSITVAGNVAYAAKDTAGVEILDVSDPAAMARYSAYDTPGFACRVKVAGSLAYLADGSSGLAVLDVSDPSAPKCLGGYDTSGTARAVQVAGNLAYLADSSLGLKVVQLGMPAQSIAGLTDSTCRIEWGATFHGAAYVMQVGPEVVSMDGMAMDQDADGALGESGEDLFVARWDRFFDLATLQSEQGGDGSRGVVIQGEASGAQTTWSYQGIRSAGDVNGDGYDDMIVGIEWASPNGDKSGQAAVVFGKADGWPAELPLESLNGANGFFINGVDTADRFGQSVSSAGDFNGDGCADLLIGAEWASPEDSVGAGYVLFGSRAAFAKVLEASALDGTNGFRLSGRSWENSRAGFAAACAGDFNGDGLDDVILGAELARGNVGRAYVIFGRAEGNPPVLDLDTLDGTRGFILQGADSEQLGFYVNSAGDVNGDGLSDVIVGAPAPGKDAPGQAYVLLGTAARQPSVVYASQLSGAAGFALLGAAPGDMAGASVGSAGDFNGDGYGDLVVGAPQAAPNGELSGAVYVVFGSETPATVQLGSLDGQDGTVLRGAAAHDFTGRSVNAAGDVNGDGYDDLLIGAPACIAGNSWGYGTGRAYLVLGRGGDLPCPMDLASLELPEGFAFLGIDGSDALGQSISSAGDVDGDGFADIFLDAPLADPREAWEAGETYLVFGQNFLDLPIQSGTPGDDALDGTAVADYLVGAQGPDTLVGGGGMDVLYGGEGDDVLSIADAAFRRVDGGSGCDTLRVATDDVLLDLASLDDTALRGIEQIDLAGARVTLVVNVLEVLNLSGTSNTLVVRGDATDDVRMGSGWSFARYETIDGEPFTVLHQGQAVLKVPQSIVSPPAAGDDHGTTLEDTPLDRSAPGLLANDADLDGDAVAVTSVDTATLRGTLLAWSPDGAFRYAPPPDYCGTDEFDYTITDAHGLTATAHVSLTVSPVADVTGRLLFYNHSTFDGNDAAADAQDYNAIAPPPSIRGHGHPDGSNELDVELGKQALLPGQTATFVNYSSYAKGINGILIVFDDLAAPEAITTADFQFRVGNDSSPAAWAAAPVPSAIRVEPNVVHAAFTGRPDVVTITWADENPYTRGREPGAISNQWLQVTVLANAHTGLSVADVFCWGNQIGEVGNSPVDTNVDQNDAIGARNHQHSAFNPAPIEDPYDFNRDGKVDQNDEILARNNPASAFGRIQLIAAPALLQAAPAGGSVASDLAAAVTLKDAPAASGIKANGAAQRFDGTEDEDFLPSAWSWDEDSALPPLPPNLTVARCDSRRADLFDAVMRESGELFGRPYLPSAADDDVAVAVDVGRAVAGQAISTVQILIPWSSQRLAISHPSCLE